MSLGLQTESGSGNFLPIVKYDAKAGRMFRVDRSQDADGSWTKNEVDITDNAVFIVDLAHVDVGWISFASGAPDFVMVPLGEALPARPTDGHKQGFRVRIKLSKSCGGDVREFSHTAKAVLAPFDAIHTAYTNAGQAKAGKLPVIKFAGTTPIKTKTPQGTTTNYAPIFEIAGWRDRPEDLPAPAIVAATNGEATTTSTQTKGAAPMQHTRPPVRQEAVTADAEF